MQKAITRMLANEEIAIVKLYEWLIPPWPSPADSTCMHHNVRPVVILVRSNPSLPCTTTFWTFLPARSLMVQAVSGWPAMRDLQPGWWRVGRSYIYEDLFESFF